MIIFHYNEGLCIIGGLYPAGWTQTPAPYLIPQKLLLLSLDLRVILTFRMFNKFHCSILAICPIYFNDMNRRVALLVHLLLPGDEEVQYVMQG